MAAGQLQRRRAEYPWRLRAAWATGEPISVRFEIAKDEIRRVAGWVTHVASTGSTAHMRLEHDDDDDPPMMIPLDYVLAVDRLDHFHQTRGRPPRRGAPGQIVFEGQLGLVEAPPVSDRAKRVAMEAAAQMLPPDVLGVIAAIDRAGRRPTLADISRETGRSERWCSKRVHELELRGYVRRFRRARKRDLFIIG